VAHGTIAVNVTRLEREFNACETPRCIYPSIFNRFPVIQACSLKIHNFSTFLAHFGIPVYTPGTIAVNVTLLERGFNAIHLLQYIYRAGPRGVHRGGQNVQKMCQNGEFINFRLELLGNG